MAWSLFSQPGVSPKSWANSLLKAGNFPQTRANQQSLIAWALLEGGGGSFNPLNTTQAWPGSSCFNSICVRDYGSWGDGISATVKTLNSGLYSDVTAALRSGQGLGAGSYSGLFTWSGHGYSNVSSEWHNAIRYMSGKGITIPGGSSSGSGETLSSINPAGSLVSGLLHSLGLGSATDMLIRLGLILLGGVFVIIGVFMLAGKPIETAAITVAAPEARAARAVAV